MRAAGRPLFLGCILFAMLLFNFVWVKTGSANPLKPLPHPQSDDIAIARQLGLEQPGASPEIIANQVPIGKNYKALLRWMLDDLRHYYNHFEAIFEAKLNRIARHEQERSADLATHTATVRKQLLLAPDDVRLQKELLRLYEIHKPHGFIAQYNNSTDFIRRFVGPRGKILKSLPSPSELRQMNAPGMKHLYVDTWAVPFFNTGTQTRRQAKEGLLRTLQEFQMIDLRSNISLRRFSEYLAMFARPEFDDLRRYKLIPFPRQEQLQRFSNERSDARTFGQKFPGEAMVVINKPIDLGPVSFIFGQRLSIFGLINHSEDDNIADGRIFTGPADFLEHDYAHAFFNLSPAIPGNAEDWDRVHREFIDMRDAETNAQVKRMMRLVYYHFTHESGFRVLHPDPEGNIDLAAFENEYQVIDELINTRHHYDFILANNAFPHGYKIALDNAFSSVGTMFKLRFLKIQSAQGTPTDPCPRVLTLFNSSSTQENKGP